MHGIVHSELRSFLVDRVGEHGWHELAAGAGIEDGAYRTTGTYPDEEITALVLAYSRRSRRRLGDILEEFGQTMAGDLLDTYAAFVRPEWRALDVIEHTEQAMHRAVRLHDPDAAPPRLRVERRGEDEVAVFYDSERRLCGFGVGVIRGIAERYGEPVTITQATCHHLGDPHCEIVVRRAGEPA
ncbi:MAG: heme NO-binding domain-containing protein [Actinomycetota bacterium]|nr:heme NO-binding domain-containing protein [Actinomycetota bacterium]